MTCKYRKITQDGIKVETIGNRSFLTVEPSTLKRLIKEAFNDMEFYLREHHLESWVEIINDPEATENDKFVCSNLLENAIISAEGDFPLCQDTGTATIFGWKGEQVLTGGDDRAIITNAVEEIWQEKNLRFSQNAPLNMFDEKNTKNNLPAQIDIQADKGKEYRFMLLAKGGGSTNKTVLHMGSKAMLNEKSLKEFLQKQIQALGVAACPPYFITAVIGGTSPEANLRMLKLAMTGYCDNFPEIPATLGEPIRSKEWEKIIMQIAQDTGWGAQFGGKYMAMDARVIRMARHGGSCPVSIGVSCSAHRNLFAKITAEGAFIEELDKNPARFANKLAANQRSAATINLDVPMEEILKQFSKRKPGDLVFLNGTMIVARDLAHARLKEISDSGKPLPEYFTKHPVYYAGPAKTPKGYPIGSFGPTTAQRMDSYIDYFMQRGASMVSLAKGNRSEEVVAACKKHGGFYLGTIGGAAALIAREHITSSEVIDFPEFGMEAVHKITVKDMPAFIIYDDKGNRLY